MTVFKDEPIARVCFRNPKTRSKKQPPECIQPHLTQICSLKNCKRNGITFEMHQESGALMAGLSSLLKDALTGQIQK